LVLAAIGLLLICGATKEEQAQEVQARPVARLVAAPASTTKDGTGNALAILSTHSESESFVSSSPTIRDATVIERRAFERTNEQRVQEGLVPLEWEPALCLMARHHSEEMARLGYFSHQSPDGLRLKDRARQEGIARFRLIAENIAYNQGFADPGAVAVERWMLSPGHRANILYRDFQVSAVGTFVSPDGTVFLTQVFLEH
jgi:uncharacterized protein YkwD